MSFRKLGINENTVDILNKLGINKPTPIQIESIPPIIDGQDVMGEAQTGTGKTLAFLLPIFEKISSDINSVQTLIISPTRELALQIYDEAIKLNEQKNINILAAYGGKDINAQIKKLNGNVQMIIATPGRLLDHINRKTVDLSKLKTFVLDEADQMLLLGFKNEIESIIKELPKKRQTLCFSATLNSQVKKLAYRYMLNPVVVTIKKEKITLDTIKQNVVETTDRKKQDALCSVLDQDNPFMAIIFCRTKRRVDNLELALSQRGYDCKKIHSDITQSKREKILNSFRESKFQYLIATDVASRGLDIEGVSHIYNYDIPESPEDYIHRIGRTGRAGEKGYTCLFVTQKNENILQSIEETIEYKIPVREL